MYYKLFKPSNRLAPFVKFYWLMQQDHLPIGHETQRIIPHGCIELNISFGDQLKIKHQNSEDNNQSIVSISGHFTRHYEILQTGKTGLLTIMFKPQAARLFFNLPMSDIKDQNVDGMNFFPPDDIREIGEKIGLQGFPEEKVRIVENFLLNKINESKYYNYRRLLRGMNKINQLGGLIRISELADLACLSTKQYDRVFEEYIGIKPKKFLKTVRFQNALYQKQLGNATNLTELAHLCGYFDQSHFINDFKALSGFTPKQYFSICEPFSDYYSTQIV